MKRILYNITIVLGISVIFIACTKDFEEINNDPNTLEISDIETVTLLPDFFRYALRNEHYMYQRGDMLFSNLYAQYFANTNGSFLTGQYQFNDGWASELWSRGYYTGPGQVLMNVKNKYEADPELNNNTLQLVRILYASVSAFMTDQFGDIPYFETIGISGGYSDDAPHYNTQKEIYYDIFNELKDAHDNITVGTSDPALDQYDFVYNNNFENWKAFANSLRLRYAIRISKVDPVKAQQEGEAALQAGVMTSFNQSARCFVDPEDISDQRGNPLYSISDWNEFRMSQVMEDILENTSSVVDPREALWFAQPAQYLRFIADPDNQRSNDPDDLENGNAFKGLPNGLTSSDLSGVGNTYDDNSNIWREGPYFHQWRRHNLMTYAEVCFLKAEAALLGWNGAGDAKTNYEEGIVAAMQEATYTNENMPNFDPISTTEIQDYMNGGNVPFKTAGTTEEKLEQIITQKWLAVFPNGFEAWSEFRRTGYPKLIPVSNNLDSDIPTGQFIKKLRLVQSEYDLNDNLDLNSINQGQGDNQNVKVWWDIN